MERRRLTKRQICVAKPDLHHEPRDRLDSPVTFWWRERPECKEQAGKADRGNAHEEDKLCNHTAESAGGMVYQLDFRARKGKIFTEQRHCSILGKKLAYFWPSGRQHGEDRKAIPREKDACTTSQDIEPQL